MESLPAAQRRPGTPGELEAVIATGLLLKMFLCCRQRTLSLRQSPMHTRMMSASVIMRISPCISPITSRPSAQLPDLLPSPLPSAPARQADLLGKPQQVTSSRCQPSGNAPAVSHRAHHYDKLLTPCPHSISSIAFPLHS